MLPGGGGSGDTLIDAPDMSIDADMMTSSPPDADNLPRPANDKPADAIDVSAGGMFTWDPTNAIDDVASPCASAAGPDVFFKITLMAPEVIYLETFGSSADSVIAIRAGDCSATGTAEACVDNSCGGNKSQGAWNLAAGTHCIVVDQVGTNGGAAGKLNVVKGRRTGDPLPAATGTVMGNTCNDDNNNNATCGCEAAEDHHYFVTVCPATTPTLRIFTCNGATWDTVLQIRSNGTTGSSLACEDDNCGDVQTDISAALPGPGLFWAIVDGCNDCGMYTMTYSIQ